MDEDGCMSIPLERAGKGIYRGPRFNKNPALIGGALIVLFLLGLYYAGEKRNRTVNQQIDASTAVYNIEAEPESTIELLNDKPDGLAGRDRDRHSESPEDAVSAEDRMADTLAELLENQKIDSLRISNERRAKFETAQIQAYEEAIRSHTEVPGFGTDPNGGKATTNDLSELTYPTANARHAAVIVPTSAVGHSPIPENTYEGTNADKFNNLLQSPQAKELLTAVGFNNAPNRLSTTNTSAVDAASNFISEEGRPSRFELEASLEAPRSPYEIKVLENQAIAMISATNSTMNPKRLRIVGKDWLPYLDQRTGAPTSDKTAVLVVTDSAVDAFALAVALYVQNPREGQFRSGQLRPRPAVKWLLGSATAPLENSWGWADLNKWRPRAP